MAHMNQRIRDAEHERAQEVNPRLLEEIQELGRRLLYISAAEEVKFPRQPLWADDPRLLVAKLEASAEGCRWLLARWAEFRILLRHGYRWNVGELLRFIRLQGKNVTESVYDPMLNVLFVAWDVLAPGFAAEEWENFREERFRTDPSFNHRQRWREIVARPGNAAEATEVLCTLIADQVENLNELLARNEAREAVADPDWADRAALDLSPGFERLRRYQSAKIRELQRTLDTLCKLRKAELGSEDGDAEKADGECQVADAQCQMADEPCEVESGNCELETPQSASNEANLDSTQSTYQQEVESEKPEPPRRERSQSAAGGQVVRDAGRHDSQRLMKGSTNDAMGISPHEETNGAVEACPGDGPELSLDRAVKTPQTASNEANCAPWQGVDFQRVRFPPGKWVAPAGSYRSDGGTIRATFGGALASRELWFGRSGSRRYLSLRCGLVTRVSGRITFGASCPRWSLAREASTLSLATCYAGASRRGIDPVGETSNVPDTLLARGALLIQHPHPRSGDIHGRPERRAQEANQAQEAGQAQEVT